MTFTDDLLKMADRLRDEIREIQASRQAQETELAAIENAALKQRFQKALSKLIAQEQEKKEEVPTHFTIYYLVLKLILLSFPV